MNYYLIGIKGSGMSSLACILHDLGNNVFGYDDSKEYKYTLEGLNKRGIKIYHQGDNIDLDRDTIVTYTAAMDIHHPEIERVRNMGINVIPYKDIMGDLTKKYKSICISGTHGKTTTTLLIAKIFDKAFGCNYFVGDGEGKGNNKSDLLIIESCEFNKHFLSYYPNDAIVTNIDLDHTETYKNIDMMISSFNEFINKTRNNVILCGDDSNILKLHTNKAFYYGFNSNNDLIIKNRRVVNDKTCFDIYYKNELFDSYSIKMFGDHLILDISAAILISILYNVDKKIIKEVVESFLHAKRRFSETIIGNNIIIDDYAHHPTEIRATFDSAKQKYPNKKIYAIFLPNTYSRTKDLFNEFVKSLKLFDKAYLMDIECDREKQEDYPNISSYNLSLEIPNSEMISLESCDKLKDIDNTVICLMSCANTALMLEKLKEVLK